jgi:hypothetical protein
MTDRPVLIRLIAALAATFNREADEATFQGYELGLGDLPIEAVQRAVTRAICERRFMPSPAELRELSGELLPADRAIKAWEAFEKAVARHGYYTSVDFDDQLINATVRNLGGWERVSEKEGDEFSKWLRKDFERVYLAFLRSGVSAEAAAPLIGFIDRTNAYLNWNAGNNQFLAEHDTGPLRIACDLPPHREGLIKLPGPRPEAQKLLADAAALIGGTAADYRESRKTKS